MRVAVTDFGITTRPCCRCQRSTTCAGVRCTRSAIATITGSAQHRALSQRAPRFGGDAVRRVERLHVPLLQGRVQFDLIDGGHGAAEVEDALQLVGQEVRDADGPHPPLGVERFERPPGVEVAIACRCRPVDQKQVDRVEAELRQARLEAGQGAVVAPGRCSTAWWSRRAPSGRFRMRQSRARRPPHCRRWPRCRCCGSRRRGRWPRRWWSRRPAPGRRRIRAAESRRRCSG